VKGKFYKEITKRLIAGVHRLRPEFQESRSWYLLYDNVPAQSSGVVFQFLAKEGSQSYPHAPYSPDLAPADFSLFPKLKIAMRGTCFDAVSSIRQTVTTELKDMLEEAFCRAFDSLYQRCKLRAEAGGEC
jgi:hypothetical protein